MEEAHLIFRQTTKTSDVIIPRELFANIFNPYRKDEYESILKGIDKKWNLKDMFIVFKFKDASVMKKGFDNINF